jgi:hypothetical protein
MNFTYNAYSTANFGANSNASQHRRGHNTLRIRLRQLSAGRGRRLDHPSVCNPSAKQADAIKPIAPYAEDIYKVTRKLTLDIGIRWDFLPPFHEVQNRWTFLNPNLTNSLTGTPGMLQFAGNWGGAGSSCNCKTPVQDLHGKLGTARFAGL